MKDLKNLILGTTIYDDNFIPYCAIVALLTILGCIIYVIVSYINHLKEEKNKELRSKILANGQWLYYDRDEKGRWFNFIERREKEKAKAKKEKIEKIN